MNPDNFENHNVFDRLNALKETLSNDEIKAGKMLKSPNPVASKAKNIEFPNNIINLNNLKL